MRSEQPRAVDRPEPGFFRLRLVRGGPWVPARIECQEGMWWAVINDEVCASARDPLDAPHVFHVWHNGQRIDEAEFNYLTEIRNWRLRYEAASPLNNPFEPIDLSKLPPVF